MEIVYIIIFDHLPLVNTDATSDCCDAVLIDSSRNVVASIVFVASELAFLDMYTI